MMTGQASNISSHATYDYTAGLATTIACPSAALNISSHIASGKYLGPFCLLYICITDFSTLTTVSFDEDDNRDKTDK
ncbi:hypothetical protein BDN67DRAFT_965473 [Paxillus ammoniavirescens]|nr:hypothetical protein BDN67DRAFT_965473 [Paxillus ammoniavirescens]